MSNRDGAPDTSPPLLTSIAGPPTISQVVVASSPTGVVIDYELLTSAINAGTGSPATIFSGTSILYHGVMVKIEISFPTVGGSVPGDIFKIMLLFDGTELGHWLSGTPSGTPPFYGVTYDTPAQGTHTYSVQAQRTSGTGTPNVGGGAGSAGNVLPAFLRITVA